MKCRSPREEAEHPKRHIVYRILAGGFKRLGRWGWHPRWLLLLFRLFGRFPKPCWLEVRLMRLGRFWFPNGETKTVILPNGLQFECHLQEDWQTLVYLCRSYNSGSHQMVRRLIFPGDDLVDLGANFGWYSLHFARWAGPSGRVTAVEPLSEAAGWLSTNLGLNGFQRVQVVRAAVTDFEGEARLYRFHRWNSVRATLSRQRNDHCDVETVKTTTLSELLRDRQRPPVLIKCDCEGEEFSILQGSGALLSHELRPMWLMELADNLLKFRGHSASQVLAFMLDRGYRALLLDVDRCVPIDEPQPVHGDVLFYDPELHAERVEPLKSARRRFQEWRELCHLFAHMRQFYRTHLSFIVDRLKRLGAAWQDARLRRELKRVVQAFEERGLRCVVTGGFAREAHGCSDKGPRGDLDLTVSEDSAEDAVKLLEQLGYSGFSETYGIKKGSRDGLNLDLFIQHDLAHSYLIEGQVEVVYPKGPDMEPVRCVFLGEPMWVSSVANLVACYQNKTDRAAQKLKGLVAPSYELEWQPAVCGVLTLPASGELKVFPEREQVGFSVRLLRLTRLVHAQRVKAILEESGICHAFWGEMMFAELGWGSFQEFWPLTILVEKSDFESSRQRFLDLGGTEDTWGIWLWGSRLEILPVEPEGSFLWRNYRHPLATEALHSPSLYRLGFLELPSVPLALLKAGFLLKHGLLDTDVRTSVSRNPRITVRFPFETES